MQHEIQRLKRAARRVDTVARCLARFVERVPDRNDETRTKVWNRFRRMNAATLARRQRIADRITAAEVLSEA